MKIPFSSLVLLATLTISLSNCSHSAHAGYTEATHMDADGAWYNPAKPGDEGFRPGNPIIDEALASCHYSDREIDDAWEHGDATGDYSIIDTVYDGDSDTLNDCTNGVDGAGDYYDAERAE